MTRSTKGGGRRAFRRPVMMLCLSRNYRQGVYGLIDWGYI